MITTKKTFTKAICFAVAIVTMVMCLVFATTKASASWYGRTYATFSNGLYSQEYYFDGNNVGLTWTSAHNSVPTHINNGDGFYITLEKKGFLGVYTSLGTKNFSRSGGGTGKWESVGSGTYRFRFHKATDGTTQYVEDIEMYSW